MKTLINQSIAHTGPASFEDGWPQTSEVTRGVLRTLIAEVRAIVNELPGVRDSDMSAIEQGMDKLLNDIHAAAHLRQLKSRAQAGLPISADDVLGDWRPAE